MFLLSLFSQPLFALVYIVALISSLTIHEFAHALVGKWRGDKTAEHLGRLTLNPLAHLDFTGTLVLLIAGFGWAKPVPFDPRQLRNPLLDGSLIALAGPVSNLSFAVVSAACFQVLNYFGALPSGSLLPVFLVLLIIVNLNLFLFNLIPIPPLDGSHLLDAALFSTKFYKLRMYIELYGPQILMFLIFLSLITPVDPFWPISWANSQICSLLIGGRCF